VLARVRAEVAGGGRRSFREAPDHEGETFAEDVAWEIDLAGGVRAAREPNW